MVVDKHTTLMHNFAVPSSAFVHPYLTACLQFHFRIITRNAVVVTLGFRPVTCIGRK